MFDEINKKYNASSPDELALVNAADKLGIKFIKKDEENIVYLKDTLNNRDVEYKLLNILEFTSARKRMSVVVREV